MLNVVSLTQDFFFTTRLLTNPAPHDSTITPNRL